MKTTIATLALLILATPLLAQEPPEEEEYDVEKALKEVTEMLTEAERLLVEAIKPRSNDPEEAAEATEKALEAIEKLLQGSQQAPGPLEIKIGFRYETEIHFRHGQGRRCGNEPGMAAHQL